MDIKAVQSFLRHYKTKVLSSPNLYVNGDSYIDVILPAALLEYSNAASGRGGKQTGGRVRGIRREVSNPLDALTDIFSSEQTLIDFLNSSEQDANLDDYVPTVKTKKSVQQALFDYHTANKDTYKVAPKDAKTIRESMETFLKSIKKPTDADMVAAAEQAFESYKK